jgi:hypothetical protein
MYMHGERIASMLGACLLGTTLLAPVALSQAAQGSKQDDTSTPTLTTDDLRDVPGAIIPRPTAEADKKPETTSAKSATKGYTTVTTKSGYSFERPDSWKPVTLSSKGAPTFFNVDAVFQDSKTGAVATAISVDRSKLKSPVDIADKSAVNTLLGPMLNAGDAKATVKVQSRETGEIPDKNLEWVRIQAEGKGQMQGGGTVASTFWVQMVQTPNLLALIAVGYPSSQQTASNAALHTVQSLEVTDASRSESGRGARPKPTEKPVQKDSAGGMRTP